MKKILISCVLLIAVAVTWSGCDDKNPYDGGVASPYIFAFDLRKLYKGADVVLSPENMYGGHSIKGVVVSDHTAKNLPEGYLMLENSRLASSGDSIRGIIIPVGAAAANYQLGDSIRVRIEGKTLTMKGGMMQITGAAASDIEKIKSNAVLPANRVTTATILADPTRFEGSQVTIAKASFNPQLAPGATYSGDRVINDGFGDIVLRTDPGATFANSPTEVFANYTGVILLTADANGKFIPHLRIRKLSDVKKLTPQAQPAFIITGAMADPQGGTANDGNYEYMQFRALRAINFANEKFSVIATNNAGSPGTPPQGWATGGARTYKFDLTTGTVNKGDYFYVGGNKKVINQVGSTSIASSKWIREYDYAGLAGAAFSTNPTVAGGTKTTNLLANSGNASGIAVFAGTEVKITTVPIDVIFIGTGGTLYSKDPVENGYRVNTTDYYDQFDPITGAGQEYYRAGTNTFGFPYPSAADQDAGFFLAFGGVFDTTLGKWAQARSQFFIPLTKTSTINAIENVGYSTTPGGPIVGYVTTVVK